MDFLLTFLMDSNFGTLYLKTFPGKKTGIKTSRKIFENKTGEQFSEPNIFRKQFYLKQSWEELLEHNSSENHLINKLYFQYKFPGKRFWEHFWETFPQKSYGKKNFPENIWGKVFRAKDSLEIFLSKIVVGRNYGTFPMQNHFKRKVLFQFITSLEEFLGAFLGKVSEYTFHHAITIKGSLPIRDKIVRELKNMETLPGASKRRNLSQMDYLGIM